MSTTARPVVKASTMPGAMQEFAIIAAQEAIAAFATEQEIASSIKAKIEQQYPAVYVVLRDGGGWWESDACGVSCCFPTVF